MALHSIDIITIYLLLTYLTMFIFFLGDKTCRGQLIDYLGLGLIWPITLTLWVIFKIVTIILWLQRK